MKKYYIKCIIGALFAMIGLALTIMIGLHWEVSLRTIPIFPFMFGGVLLFFIAGLAMIFLGIWIGKTQKKFLEAKKNDASQEELFELEEKIKEQNLIEVKCMCYPVPFILLAALFYVLSLVRDRKNAPIFAIIVLYSGIGLLAFISVGLIISLLKRLFVKKPKECLVKGELKKFIMANLTAVESNKAFQEEYRILISYNFKGKMCEYLTQETFSKEQTKLLKTFVYIPLFVSNQSVRLDKENLLKTAQDQNTSKDFEIERGTVALFGNVKTGETDGLRYSNKTNEHNDSISVSMKQNKKWNIFFAVSCIVFLIPFDGLAIFALVLNPQPMIIAYCVMAGIFSVFMIYMSIFRPIRKAKIHNLVMSHGHSAYANSYKIVNNYVNGRRVYWLKFTFTDDYGMERKAVSNILPITSSFFSSYSVDQLPIKVYEKNAIIDFDELLRYQNKDIQR